jgi:hypothetical protein
MTPRGGRAADVSRAGSGISDESRARALQSDAFVRNPSDFRARRMAVRLLSQEYQRERQVCPRRGPGPRWGRFMRTISLAAFAFVRHQLATVRAAGTALGLYLRRARPVREEEP